MEKLEELMNKISMVCVCLCVSVWRQRPELYPIKGQQRPQFKNFVFEFESNIFATFSHALTVTSFIFIFVILVVRSAYVDLFEDLKKGLGQHSLMTSEP